MLNQIVLVGRLTSNPEVQELEEGKKLSQITLKVGRNYKNADGEYDNDFIDINLYDGIAQNTADYCHEGDIIGVKGRLQTEVLEKEDGTKKYLTRIVAEKVTFLSSHKPEEEEC